MSQTWLKPDWEPGLTISNLPLGPLKERGIKFLVLDVDGTLLSGKETVLHNSVIEWTKEAKNYLTIHLLSNNPSQKRIRAIANQLGLDYTYGAGKPIGGALLKTLKTLKFIPNNTALVGDRLFTDVIAGNRAGLFTVLIKPMGEDGKISKNCYLQRFEKTIALMLLKIRK